MKVAFSRSRCISAVKVLAAIASAIVFCPIALLGVLLASYSVYFAFDGSRPLSAGVVGLEALVLGGGGIAGTLALALAELLPRCLLARMSVRIALAVALVWGASSGFVFAAWLFQYSSGKVGDWIIFIALLALALLGMHSLALLRIVPK
jgi:hypothetical protein